MKVTVITVVLNSKDTIEQTINSVLNQTYDNIEYLVFDGLSTDGTLEIIKKYEKKLQLRSEKDAGTRFAMNKALKLAKGDIVCTLNADDFYIDNFVIEKVVERFMQDNVDCIYGDMLYVDTVDTNKVIRYWKTGEYKKNSFKKGWFPTWVSFFMKKDVLEQYGYLNTDFKIANDYEFLLRVFEKFKVSSSYIPEVLVKMRAGGLSNASFKKLLIANIESYYAWKVNKLDVSISFFFIKPLSKISQYWKHKIK